MRVIGVLVLVMGLFVLACEDGPRLPRSREDAGWADTTGTFRPDSGLPFGANAGGPSRMNGQSGASGGTKPRPAGAGGWAGAPPMSEPLPAEGMDGSAADGGFGAADAGEPLRALEYGSLVVTEWMADPDTRSDDDGEWLELYNTAAHDIDLTGCTIGDGSARPRGLPEGSRVAARSYVAVASADDPGFEGAIVSPLALKNGAGVIEVNCGGLLIDRVAYDKAGGFPLAAGRATALDPMHFGAEDNDLPSAWCLAVTEYATDRGTPGRANLPCTSETMTAPGNPPGRPSATPPSSAKPPSALPPSAAPDPQQPSAPKAPTLAYGEVVISEIMADPHALSDGQGEWFELYNSSSRSIDLAGCTIGDGSAAPHAIEEPAAIPARGYATVAASAQPGFSPTLVSTIALTNGADAIELRCGDTLVDRVQYDKAAGFPIAAGAAALLRSDQLDADKNDQPSAWCLAGSEYATDRGTPGRANTACAESAPEPAPPPAPAAASPQPAATPSQGAEPEPPVEPTPPAPKSVPYGAVVITELMADPAARSDADGEWFELYNRTADSIDLQGCTIGDGSSAHAIAGPLQIPAGDYATVAAAAAPGFSPSLVTTVALTNSVDAIEIRCGEDLVDRVVYDKAAGFPIAAGASAMLDPGALDADSNDSPSAWCLAGTEFATDRGTPGRVNDTCAVEAPPPDLEAPIEEPAAEPPPAPKHLAYGALVISEVMADPKALSDADGEWFELYNATSEPIDLAGCEIEDGSGAPHAITDPITVAAGGFATVASSTAPGFNPTLATSISLTNRADAIELRCGGALVDRVAYDAGQGFPLAPGVAAALDPAQLDADSNDQPSAWCAATAEYAVDLGTPGSSNSGCVAVDPVDAGPAED